MTGVSKEKSLSTSGRMSRIGSDEEFNLLFLAH